MTVIFHTNVEMPVLAGDMLVSTLGPQRHSQLRLPSQPNGIVTPDGFVPSQYPYSLRRKTFVIGDRLAVGAAGAVEHIRLFLHALTSRFRDLTGFMRGEITQFLRDYAGEPAGRAVMREIGVILLVEADDWRGSLTGGAVARREAMSERFGKVISIGSGAERILEEIGQLDAYRVGATQTPEGRADYPEFHTLMANLMLLANVYWQEFAAPQRVFDAWGGAYDLIYRDSAGAFRHLDDYTMVLRMWDAEHPDQGMQLANLFKYERRKDFSYVVMPTRDRLEFFGARDITADDRPWRTEIHAEDLSMNSQIHVSIIAVHKGNMFMRPLIQIDGLDPSGSGRQTVFTDFDDEGHLRILFHAEHDKWLEEQVKEYYGQNAHRIP
ncbi:hypothetical protein [Candidatus Poriferisodalis sp.]|uniref:hypothetical protein n=1 Tax=Candidatus Poriferisodalis sp. TaxID=3101277 RepID=UPI003C6FD872